MILNRNAENALFSLNVLPPVQIKINNQDDDENLVCEELGLFRT